jgi:hypothetical protein
MSTDEDDAEETFEAREIRQLIDAADPGSHDGFYAIYTIYAETDAINAVANVCRAERDPTTGVKWSMALMTNDGLCSMWASPEGNLWVGSVWGNVWTTAKVPWLPSDLPARFRGTPSDPSFAWKGTRIPDNAAGHDFNVAAIWASSDQDVYFGTFEGPILRWDGAAFGVAHAENRSSIVRMHGTSAKDIWAVGRDGLVLHSNGKGFRALPLPGDAGRGRTLTGVCAISPDEVYICSTAGEIYHGNQHGLELLGEYPQSFYGIVQFEKRLILACGKTGPCELKGNRIEVLRDTFRCVGVYELRRGRVGFVEPSQKPPRVIVYEPARTDRPWAGWGT